MNGKHLQKRNNLNLSKALDVATVSMLVACILVTIPTIKNLMGLEEEVKELQASVVRLKEQQKELRTLARKVSKEVEALEVQETPAEPVQQSTGSAYTVTKEELSVLARIVYQEARGIPQKSHQAAVIWCILNRVDSGYWGDDIISVATYPHAFAWVPNTLIYDEFLDLAEDVVTRWNWEKQGLKDVGRVLPSTYLYFTGDGKLNYFTEEWRGTEYWDWSLPNPYIS